MTPSTIVSRTDAWPIVVSTIHGTEHTLPLLDETMALWFECIQRGPHALIVDLTHGHAGSSAKQRARMGEQVNKWMEDPAHARLIRNVVVLVLIFDNVVIRGIVTAVTWLIPSATPYVVAHDLDQAVELATGALGKQGIVLTPALVARARAPAPRPSVRRPSY